MKDPNLLLSILSIVWVITTGLFVYIIKLKDKVEEDTKSTLDEIKELMSDVNISVNTLKSNLENNVNSTKNLDTIVRKQGDEISALKTKVGILLESNSELKRRIGILERKVNTLKN